MRPNQTQWISILISICLNHWTFNFFQNQIRLLLKGLPEGLMSFLRLRSCVDGVRHIMVPETSMWACHRGEKFIRYLTSSHFHQVIRIFSISDGGIVRVWRYTLQ